MVKVLLIEQEILYREAFGKMMQNVRNASLCAVAGTGMEAMKMINKYHPQIVFSEVLLGNENGIDICRAIKKSYPEISVNILSNYRSMGLMNKAIQSGVENYYIKPLSLKELQKCCSSHDDMQSLVEDEFLKELILSVENRDFTVSYENSKAYVHHIFESEDASAHRSIFKETANRLFSMVPGMDPVQKKYYMQKHKINAKTMTGEALASCWLIFLVTEVYRQLCVIRYTQMNKALQFIESNINNDISLTDIANHVEVSNGYLSRIFKKCYRTSVVDYIHIRKILDAKKYMLTSEMSISDISFLLGYSEAGYFSKVFKKYEGITPSTFCELYC